MQRVSNLLSRKGLRMVKYLVGDILGVQVVAYPLGYGHVPLLSRRITTLPSGLRRNHIARIELIAQMESLSWFRKKSEVVLCFVMFVKSGKAEA
jgi:hypothetical protein